MERLSCFKTLDCWRWTPFWSALSAIGVTAKSKDKYPYLFLSGRRSGKIKKGPEALGCIYLPTRHPVEMLGLLFVNYASPGVLESTGVHSEVRVLVKSDTSGARVAQWWEHLPPTNVAGVLFAHSTPYVGWVCCWFSPFARRGFSPGTPISPSP